MLRREGNNKGPYSQVQQSTRSFIFLEKKSRADGQQIRLPRTGGELGGTCSDSSTSGKINVHLSHDFLTVPNGRS